MSNGHSLPDILTSPAAPDNTDIFADDILVIDDERAITEWIAEVLQDEGYTVRIAYNGASGLMAILALQPALVLLDIGMPVIAGDEILRYLRSHGYAQLPIVVMTAGVNPRQFLNIGATDILAKPFSVNALLASVAQHIRVRDKKILVDNTAPLILPVSNAEPIVRSDS